LLNYYLPSFPGVPAWTGLGLSVGPVYTLGNAPGVSKLGLFVGGSVHLYRSFFLTPGVHIGEFADFPAGFHQGSVIPSGFGSLTPVTRNTAHFAMGITFKTASFKKSSQSNGSASNVTQVHPRATENSRFQETKDRQGKPDKQATLNRYKIPHHLTSERSGNKMNSLNKSAHNPVSSRSSVRATVRHLSHKPHFGVGDRHPIHSHGFEAIEGFRLRSRKTAGSRLRNISELTYASHTFKLQLGEAASSQTQISDTTVYPWRANALLKINVPGKSDPFLGTGWFIGPYALVTAAHVVYPREPGVYAGWASQIEVIPGSNGISDTPPFGSFISNNFSCPDGWQSEGDQRLDYGVVLLTQGIGSQVGTYGFSTYSDDDLTSAVANLAGYPEYKPDGTPALGTQWYDAGNVTHVDESFIYYDLAAQPGESGSCVYRNIGEERSAIAIHTAGQSTGTDRGLRITEYVFENLQQWASTQG
jgi:glutamyl endopeptidase